MTESLGSFRPFWWLNVGMVAASILLTIFGFPETKYHRAPPAEVIAHAQAKHGVTSSQEEETSEKSNARATAPDLVPVPTEARDPFLGRGYPSRQQWGLYQPSPDPVKTVIKELWLPWKLFAFPIVEFAAFVVSWSCSSFLTLNLTQSEVFAAPPYNISSQNIGFMNFAILVGAMIGLATAGPFSDWVSKRLTLRNRGIREPEMR